MDKTPKSPQRYLWPALGIIALIFILNIFQPPSPDDWDQVGEASIHGGPWYIVSRYFVHVSRIGDIYPRIFLYLFRDNIFLEVAVFGAVNALLLVLFLLGLFRLIGGKNRLETPMDISLFAGLFFFVYISGHFNQSYIVQFGAATYFWTIFNALFFIFPYYRLLTSSKPFLPWPSVCIFGLLAGWGSELLGPVLLLALGAAFLYLVFIKKSPPPPWFYAGGLMLLLGWGLVFWGPGHRLRNAHNVQYYVPLLQRKPLDILRSTASWFGIYTAATLPLSIPSVVTLFHLKKNAPEQKTLFYGILSFLLLGFSTAFFFAFLLVWMLPPRAWIVFSFFFIIALGFSYNYYLHNNPHPRWPRAIALLLICVGTLHLAELAKYRRALLPLFAQIEAQKAASVKDIRIETPMYTLKDAFFLRWVDDIFIQDWVLSGMASYYGVNSIRFINPNTQKPHAPRNNLTFFWDDV